MELRDVVRLQRYKNICNNREAEEEVEGRTLNRVGCNAGRSGTYYEGIGVWEAMYNGSPMYICRKHLNDIRFVCLIFTVNVEVEGWL